MLAKPFGAVLRLVLRLIVEVPLALSRGQRLRGDHRPPSDGAPSRRIALFGEGCAGQEREGGCEADQPGLS